MKFYQTKLPENSNCDPSSKRWKKTMLKLIYENGEGGNPEVFEIQVNLFKGGNPLKSRGGDNNNPIPLPQPATIEILTFRYPPIPEEKLVC
jgi:hypothetical protein